MLKKIFTTENITTFVLTALACYVGAYVLPNVFASIRNKVAPAA